MSNYSTNVTSDAVANMYGNSGNATNNYQPKNSFDANNYLDTSLEKGEKSREIQIRILPISSTDSRPFVEIKTHSMRVSKKVAKSKFKSYICLNSPNLDDNGEHEDCPLCAKGRYYYKLALLEKTDEEGSTKNADAKRKYYTEQLNNEANYAGLSPEEADDLRKYYANKAQEAPNANEYKAFMDKAKPYFSKVTYIARVIERGKESQGPKFWRFNARNDEGDPFNQIRDIFFKRQKEQAKIGVENYNVYDLYNGRDFYLKITPASSGKGVAINVTDEGVGTPLSENIELANSWINDTKVWKDMYSRKNAQYLSIIGEGQIPTWSKEEGGWYGVVDADAIAEAAEKEAENAKIMSIAERAKEAPAFVAPKVEETSSSEDLPF